MGVALETTLISWTTLRLNWNESKSKLAFLVHFQAFLLYFSSKILWTPLGMNRKKPKSKSKSCHDVGISVRFGYFTLFSCIALEKAYDVSDTVFVVFAPDNFSYTLTDCVVS